jgi:hypothetical protein
MNNVHIEIIEPNENLAYGGAAWSMREAAYKEGFGTLPILESLLVKNPEDFGKGYGKKAFHEILEKYSEIILFPFSMYYPELDQAYAGRVRMDSLEAMDRGVKELIEKFYIPQIKKAGKKFKRISAAEGNFFLVVY